MKAVIDTSSLISLVRYYMPFDGNSKLSSIIQQKIEEKEIIVLDKVVMESTYTAKGIVIDKLDYLTKRKNQVRTDEILPNPKFFNMVENQFSNSLARNKLSSIEFEQKKTEFLDSADVKLILYCLQEIKAGNDVMLVTEETEGSNDQKPFKKLPAICKMLDIKVATLPALLQSYGINVEFK